MPNPNKDAQEIVDSVKKEAAGGPLASMANWLWGTYNRVLVDVKSRLDTNVDGREAKDPGMKKEAVNRLEKRKDAAADFDRGVYRHYKEIKTSLKAPGPFFHGGGYDNWYKLANEIERYDRKILISSVTSVFMNKVSEIDSMAKNLKRQLELIRRRIEEAAKVGRDDQNKRDLVYTQLGDAVERMNTFLSDATVCMSGYVAHVKKIIGELEKKGTEGEAIGIYKMVKVYFFIKTAGCKPGDYINVEERIDEPSNLKKRGFFEASLSKEYALLVDYGEKELAKAAKAAEEDE